jgi:hypothetical protein
MFPSIFKLRCAALLLPFLASVLLLSSRAEEQTVTYRVVGLFTPDLQDELPASTTTTQPVRCATIRPNAGPVPIRKSRLRRNSSCLTLIARSATFPTVYLNSSSPAFSPRTNWNASTSKSASSTAKAAGSEHTFRSLTSRASSRSTSPSKPARSPPGSTHRKPTVPR